MNSGDDTEYVAHGYVMVGLQELVVYNANDRAIARLHVRL